MHVVYSLAHNIHTSANYYMSPWICSKLSFDTEKSLGILFPEAKDVITTQIPSTELLAVIAVFIADSLMQALEIGMLLRDWQEPVRLPFQWYPQWPLLITG